MRNATIFALVSLAAACLLVACSSQAPAGGRGGRGGIGPGGRGGIGPGGRGGPVAVGQRGRGAPRGGGRGRGAGSLDGVDVRTYRFEETGEMLEYAVFVSSKVKKGTKSPLVIALHGRGVGPTSVIRHLTGPAERAGFIVAAPMGYNERGWYGEYESDRSTPPELREYSEKDVMNVLAFMREEFDIDENRIYIMGSSMGGAGALYLAVKHPHLWAAVAAGAPPIRRTSETITNFAAIRHMPVMLVHGDRDALVTVDVSRRLSSLMQDLGMTYEYREIRGGSHPNAIDMGAPWMTSFLERHTRSSAPPQPIMTLSGDSARTLASLLSTGSARVFEDLSRDGRFVLRDLVVLRQATSKFDPDDPRFGLDVFSASARIGNRQETTTIGEASSLHSFLVAARVPAGTSLQGSDYTVEMVLCSVDASQPASASQRYRCTLSLPPRTVARLAATAPEPDLNETYVIRPPDEARDGTATLDQIRAWMVEEFLYMFPGRLPADSIPFEVQSRDLDLDGVADILVDLRRGGSGGGVYAAFLTTRLGYRFIATFQGGIRTLPSEQGLPVWMVIGSSLGSGTALVQLAELREDGLHRIARGTLAAGDSGTDEGNRLFEELFRAGVVSSETLRTVFGRER